MGVIVMRRVLLVDDESFIRKGIRTIIERSETNFKDIGECWNGMEALERISAEKFDLVILDMRMPRMDGITFMKEAQKLENKPKFLVLSGYNDFKYAAESLKYGAKEYLLKPIQRDKLIDALKKMEEDLKREEQINNTIKKADVIIDRLMVSELNTIFMNNNLSEEQIRKIIDILEVDIFESGYRVALMRRRDTIIFGDNDSTYLRTVIERYFERLKVPVLSFIQEDGTASIVTSNAADFQGMLKYIKDNLGGEYAIGISDLSEGITQIRNAYLQAKEAQKYRIFASSDKIIYHEQIHGLNHNYKIPLDIIRKIPEMVGTNRIREIDVILTEIFDDETLRTNSISYLQEIVDCIDKSVIQYFIEHIPQKAASMKKVFEEIRNIYNFRDLEEYFHTLRNCIVEMNNFYLTLKDVYRKNNKIDAAIAYIEGNYHKDISMTMVANYVSVNYTNFSILFSEEMGISFVDYLRQVRIDKSKELLKSADYKINEISEMVGYKNPKHFAKSFKQVTGISPVEYRNKSQNFPA
jgi:two-component system, response regulator YesN